MGISGLSGNDGSRESRDILLCVEDQERSTYDEVDAENAAEGVLILSRRVQSRQLSKTIKRSTDVVLLFFRKKRETAGRFLLHEVQTLFTK